MLSTLAVALFAQACDQPAPQPSRATASGTATAQTGPQTGPSSASGTTTTTTSASPSASATAEASAAASASASAAPSGGPALPAWAKRLEGASDATGVDLPIGLGDDLAGFSGVVVTQPKGFEPGETRNFKMLRRKDTPPITTTVIGVSAERPKTPLTAPTAALDDAAKRDGVAFFVDTVKVTWEPKVELGLGRDASRAVAYRGRGQHTGSKKPRDVVLVEAAVGGKRVVAVGSWSVDVPDNEAAVLAILRSLRG